MRNKILHIGSGEAGTNIVNLMKEKYNFVCKTINTSLKDHEKAKSIDEEHKILLNGTKGFAKNIQNAREVIKEQGINIVKNLIVPSLNEGVDKIILYSSTGGGTGAGITMELARVLKTNLPKIKITTVLVSPFEYDDKTAFSNTVLMISVLEELDIPIRIISNANFINREFIDEASMHEKVNKYIIDTVNEIITVSEKDTIGRNTDEEEIEQILFNTPGYMFISKCNLSNKHKDQNGKFILNSIKTSLDMGYDLESKNYDKRLIILSANDIIASEIKIEEFNEEIGNPREVSFFTHIQPTEQSYILIALAGCEFPKELEKMIEKIKKFNEEKKEKRSLNLDLSILQNKEEEKKEKKNIYNSFLEPEAEKQKNEEKNDIIQNVDNWKF